MKIKLLGFVSLCFVAIAFLGCKEDKGTWLVETTNDPIQITKIVDPDNWDAEIVSADLDQLIKLVGKNLANVAKVEINDVEAQLSRNMLPVNGALYVKVPYIPPVNIDNKIKVTDNAGNSVSLPLTVTVPAISVEKMENEYTPVGKELTILGDYLDLYQMTTKEGKVFIGDMEVSIKTATKKFITVVVPENAPVNSKVKLVSPVKTIFCPGKFWDEDCLVASFTGATTSVNGAAFVATPSGTDPEPINGTYMRYNAKYPTGWPWTQIYYGTYTMPADLNTNAANYDFKCEVWAGAPMLGNNMRIDFGGYVIAGKFADFPQNKWVTISIPAVAFKAQGNITNTFKFILWGPDSVPMYFCIDNPRFTQR